MLSCKNEKKSWKVIYLADIWHLSRFVGVLHVLQENWLILIGQFTDPTLSWWEKNITTYDILRSRIVTCLPRHLCTVETTGHSVLPAQCSTLKTMQLFFVKWDRILTGGFCLAMYTLHVVLQAQGRGKVAETVLAGGLGLCFILLVHLHVMLCMHHHPAGKEKRFRLTDFHTAHTILSYVMLSKASTRCELNWGREKHLKWEQQQSA